MTEKLNLRPCGWECLDTDADKWVRFDEFWQALDFFKKVDGCCIRVTYTPSQTYDQMLFPHAPEVTPTSEAA